ncbi:MAG: helix-turn-helix transcriptional regulator [Oscillospiraceae bacterium]|nr:helix-turn-helix transcriptional regulator [Oscillospiraceae bacterium]
MEAESANQKIGNKIKNLRNQYGLTQQELADRAELTKGFISQLERGQVSPSIVTLLDLIECLGTTPGEFFKEEGVEQVVYSENDWFEKEEEGSKIQWIVPSAQGNEMEPVLVTLAPKAATSNDSPHPGEEFGYVLNGKIVIHRGEGRFEAQAGESFYYESDKDHWIENPYKREAKFIWVSTPPSF